MIIEECWWQGLSKQIYCILVEIQFEVFWEM